MVGVYEDEDDNGANEDKSRQQQQQDRCRRVAMSNKLSNLQ